MRSVRQSARLVSAICLLTTVSAFALAPTDASAQGQPSTTMDSAEATAQYRAADLIKRMVFQINSVDSALMRQAMAQDLTLVALYLSEEDKLKGVDDSTIDRLSELLLEDNDVLRLEAASTLGLIGPRAVRAVPVLQAALRRVEVERQKYIILPELDSKQALELALKRITGQPRSSP